ncbi:MAG: hypothetical protein HZA93_15795 [Verrucomicrobia bacterium]|nr:hypothetical protein [Verrucomicrobiota bacterium]
MTDNPALTGPARRHRMFPALLVIAAAVPVIFVAARIAGACRNLPFWDEFDSVLALLLRLDSGPGWREFFSQLFQLDSEHRTVVSRLIVAAGFGFTGGVNFDVLCVLGNLSLVLMCGLLLATLPAAASRVRLGVVLAFGLFHLEHYEAFLWSGASIDHFMVLMMVAAALAALHQGGRFALAGAGLFAVLATFTLAHGCVVWPIGAVLLWSAGRRRACAAWCSLAVLALVVFFHGFHIQNAHQIRDFSPAGLARLGQFWLALLGGPLTFGARQHAPLFGLALLGLLGWTAARGVVRRHPALAAMVAFALASLALIAFGRLEVAPAHIQSRYLILGSLVWSLAVFLVVEELTRATRPYRVLAWSLPALGGFNLAATHQSLHDADTFVWSREYPAVRFKQYGEEGHAHGFRLHPGPDTARTILNQVAARGIYQLPRLCHEVTVPEPQPNPAMVTYVTDLTADQNAVGFEGWAMLPNRRSRRGEIHALLRSEHRTLVMTTYSVARPDVAKALKEPLWRYCGYNFVLRRHRLPQEDYQIGLVITDGDTSTLKMTDHWLRLDPRHDPRLLATSQ